MARGVSRDGHPSAPTLLRARSPPWLAPLHPTLPDKSDEGAVDTPRQEASSRAIASMKTLMSLKHPGLFEAVPVRSTDLIMPGLSLGQ